MNYKLLLVVGIFLSSCQMFSQVIGINDTVYARRDIPLSYDCYVLRNDTSKQNSKLKILSASKLGFSAPNYSIQIIDSTFIRISSLGSDTTGGIIRYDLIDALGNTDSAELIFTTSFLTPDVAAGDPNLDSVVNYLDLFPIGLSYGRMGTPRHNNDLGNIFLPLKQAGNWNSTLGSINAKHADINGDGVVDSIDVTAFRANWASSRGAYKPKFSDSISTDSLSFVVADTIVMSAVSGSSISIPLRPKLSQSNKLSYGLAFSLSMTNNDFITKQDTFYSKFIYNTASNNSLWSDASTMRQLMVSDEVPFKNAISVAYCRKDGKSVDFGGNDFGVVEVVVEEILWGLKSGEVAKLKFFIKDIAWIDHKYQYMPMKPISKTVYLMKSANSSIRSVQDDLFKVYPTLVESTFRVELPISAFRYEQEYTVYNTLGTIIAQGILDTPISEINCDNWAAGLYWLQLKHSSQVIKLRKR